MRFIFRGILITRMKTISHNGNSLFLCILPPSQSKSRAKVLRSFPRSIFFHFHVCRRRRCPCTMVHVISGEWSSPDAYTNSFSVLPFRQPTNPPRRLPSSPEYAHLPHRIPFNIFLSFLRFSSAGGRSQWRRGFIIVPCDRKSDAKAMAKAGQSNTLMRLRSPHSPFRALQVPRRSFDRRRKSHHLEWLGAACKAPHPVWRPVYEQWEQASAGQQARERRSSGRWKPFRSLDKTAARVSHYKNGIFPPSLLFINKYEYKYKILQYKIVYGNINNFV